MNIEPNKLCYGAKAYVWYSHILELFKILGVLGLVLGACLTYCEAPAPEPLFSLVPAEQSGLDFSNELVETENQNIIQYLYFYNGGGVAIGDINNDGLPDVYFSSNQGSNKLYLNKGDLQFEDITQVAGVQGTGNWSTGVSMVDINADGWLDIYVCQVGAYKNFEGKNQLFINQGSESGVPRFVEQAQDYGLDHEGFSTQAAFLDYDQDGDLDVYLLCHSVHSTESYRDTSLSRKRDFRAGDKLFRNDLNEKTEAPFFTEVSESAGILGGIAGYGLGLAIGDVDKNGCPDIYIGNDFHENDFLYLNDCKGKFVESASQSLAHTSNFSMGNDLADINNDGWLDVFTADMKPEDEVIYKNSAGIDPYDIYQFKRSFGYDHQFPRNMLQVNQGKSGDGSVKFQEIGQLSGISATDWSWSALMADFDNDGYKDLHISNGIIRRPNNLDYLKFIANAQIQAQASDLELAAQMPDGKVSNYLFHQLSPGNFFNSTKSWGLERPSYSNGTAYADLDLDGDLDLVVNNLRDTAFLYENHARQLTQGHYVQVRLVGPKKNPQGIGAKVTVFTKNHIQYQELYPIKGWQSSIDPLLHFGLGNIPDLDSLQVEWPDKKRSLLIHPNMDHIHTLKYEDAKTSPTHPAAPQTFMMFARADDLATFQHKENLFLDNKREQLIPYLLSTQGPQVSIADVNGDQREDFFIGGASKQAGMLFVQTPEGNFVPKLQSSFPYDSLKEDVAVLFFDADGDKDADLYVSSAGNQFYRDNLKLKDRLYLNDGKGNFQEKTDALPSFFGQGSCVKAADIDQDGDLDVFVGNRSIPVSYGLSPDSYLLINQGNAQFSLADNEKIDLSAVGMITDAAWTDTDLDGDVDLVLVGEWMSPIVYENLGNQSFSKQLPKFSQEAGPSLHPSGWWSSIEVADLDGDGDEDWVVGNFGMNSNLQPTLEAPLTLYISDFDRNLSKDPIMTYIRQGKEYAVGGFDELSQQLVMLKKRFRKYDKFANSGITEVFSPEELKKSIQKAANYFYSAVIWNEGSNKFVLQALPTAAQAAPVHSILIQDFDRDGMSDILLGGNFYEMQPSIGRMDGSYGTLLLQEQGKEVSFQEKCGNRVVDGRASTRLGPGSSRQSTVYVSGP